MAQIWIGTVPWFQTVRGFGVVLQLRHAKRFRTEKNNIEHCISDFISDIGKRKEFANFQVTLPAIIFIEMHHDTFTDLDLVLQYSELKSKVGGDVVFLHLSAALTSMSS